MRITFHEAIKVIERIGPSTVADLAAEFCCEPKRMRKSIDDWQARGIMTHDSSKPARYFFKALEKIDRDEFGRLTKPINRDPTEEEIWGVGGLAEQERMRRTEHVARAMPTYGNIKLIMLPRGIGKLIGMQ